MRRSWPGPAGGRFGDGGSEGGTDGPDLITRAAPGRRCPGADPLAKETARPYRPLREDAGDEWRALHALVDDATPALRRAFLAAVASLRAGIDVDALEAALESGDIAAAERVLPLDDFERALEAMGDRVTELAEHAAQQTIDGISLPDHTAIRFDLISPAVLAVAQADATAHVREITEETRAALRAIVADGYARGLHPKQQAREIRERVGLTVRQQAAVATYRESLIADGFSPSVADRRAATYAKKLTRQRAQTIAETEAGMMANAGQRAAWEALVAQGLLSPEQFEREWVTLLPLPGVCEICEPLDGERAPLVGGTYRGGYVGPLAHVKCRCTERLVPKSTRPKGASNEAPT